MEKRQLGKLGEKIVPLGFGCAAIGGAYTRNGRFASRGSIDTNEIRRAIDIALSNGIQLFDVGNIYGAGDAERLLGQALGRRRQQAILQVKFGASFDEVTRTQIDYEGEISEAMVRNSLAGSLRRLQTDYIDIFQFQVGNYPQEKLPKMVELLEKLVAEGQIRSYSYGTGDIEQLRPFVEAPHCATVITNHNVLMDQAALLDYLAAEGVALLAGVPFYMGLLTGKINAHSQFDAQDVRAGWPLDSPRFASLLGKIEALREVLTSSGRTMAQGALAWLWARHPITIPVPGFRTVAQVENSLAAIAFGPFAEAEMEAIQRYD
ncbi:MAG: aldo/keto reductase [Chloroflexota bacterium]